MAKKSTWDDLKTGDDTSKILENAIAEIQASMPQGAPAEASAYSDPEMEAAPDLPSLLQVLSKRIQENMGQEQMMKPENMLQAPPMTLPASLNSGVPGRSPASLGGMIVGKKPEGTAAPVPTQKRAEMKNSQQRNVYKDADLYNSQIQMGQGIDPATGAVNAQHPVQRQLEGIQRMQDMVNDQAQAASEMNHTDFSPLAALADYENSRNGTRSNLAANYKAPEDMASKILEYQSTLQKNKNDVQKSILDNVKSLKTGSDTNSNMMSNIVGALSAFGNREGMQDERQFNQLQRLIKTDKDLQNYTNQFNNLNNSITNMMKGEELTPTQFNELQGVVNSNLGIKGNTSATERQERYMKSLGMDATTALQFATGSPQSISGGLNNPMVRHILDLANNETQNIGRQVDDRLGLLTAGTGNITSRNPTYAPMLEETKNAVKSRVKLTPETLEALTKYAPHKKDATASTGKKKLTEADIDKMSIEELKAAGLL